MGQTALNELIELRNAKERITLKSVKDDSDNSDEELIEQEHSKQKRSPLIPFLLITIFSALFVLYLGLGAYLFSALDIPTPQFAKSLLELVDKDSSAPLAPYLSRGVEGNTQKLWNCDGTYTNSPDRNSICTKVSSVNTNGSGGNKFFTSSWTQVK